MIVRADVRRGLPLRDQSIHCCVTSPPYFALRDYGDPRQIGLEKSPAEYVDRMVKVFREVRRVLRDDGTLWLNIGDSYNSGTQNNHHKSGLHDADRYQESGANGAWGGHRPKVAGMKHKDLMGIPWLLAFALRDDGWYLRSGPPWIKGSAMPESVEDRPTTAHESVFLLTKSPRYFYDPDAVRRPSASATLARDAYSRIAGAGSKGDLSEGAGVASTATLGLGGAHRGPKYAVRHDHETPSDPAGRHLRTADFARESLRLYAEALRSQASEIDRVMEDGGLLTDLDGGPLAFLVNSTPFKGAHFATMPIVLAEQCIKAGTSEKGVCLECGAPWVREVFRPQPERSGKVLANHRAGGLTNQHGWDRTGMSHGKIAAWMAENPPRTTGWRPSCSCPPADPVPATVFDPFGGAMTTVLAARRLGRVGISTELSAEYAAIGQARLRGSIYDVSGAGMSDDHPLFAERSLF